MYSKVKIAGHPLHPMLIAFPVAFYVASFAAYAYYAFAGADIFWFRLAYTANWAGVIMAVVAAIPGTIDWAVGIPKDTPAKKTGLIHMALNVAVLLLFFISAMAQRGEWNAVEPQAGASVWLTGLGVLLTLGAGFLGWTLVQTHHVGVDIAGEESGNRNPARDRSRTIPVNPTGMPI